MADSHIIRQLIDEGFIFRKTTDTGEPVELQREEGVAIYFITNREIELGYGIHRALMVDYNTNRHSEYLNWLNDECGIAAYKIIR